MSKTLEFQVFFNDLPTNNFNTLFTTLPPEKPYFAVGVPGSFHGRLFPESSIHFVYTSTSFQWMSRVPIELLDEKSGTWNKGRVHYTSASSDVIKAYEGQFGKDMENILNARAKEIVVGGMMVIIMQGIPNGMPYSQTPAGIMYDLMAESFMDMVKEGLVSEDDVDSFNLPFYAASPEEMTKLVEKNGEFSIELMELTNPSPWLTGPINMKEWVYHVRAAMKGMFIKHFKPEIVDQMFDRLLIKLLDNSDQIDSAYRDGIQLFAILKRI